MMEFFMRTKENKKRENDKHEDAYSFLNNTTSHTQCHHHHHHYRIFVNMQVYGQHTHQWAPFAVAGLLHA